MITFVPGSTGFSPQKWTSSSIVGRVTKCGISAVVSPTILPNSVRWVFNMGASNNAHRTFPSVLGKATLNSALIIAELYKPLTGFTIKRYSEKRMATFAVTDADFAEKVLKSEKPILVDFWAVWCGPCRLAEPVLEELSEEYKDKVLIAKLDVDTNQKSAADYDVMSIPTTILYRDGKEIGRQIGFAGKKAFEDLMKKGI